MPPEYDVSLTPALFTEANEIGIYVLCGHAQIHAISMPMSMSMPMSLVHANVHVLDRVHTPCPRKYFRLVPCYCPKRYSCSQFNGCPCPCLPMSMYLSSTMSLSASISCSSIPMLSSRFRQCPAGDIQIGQRRHIVIRVSHIIRSSCAPRQ